jgi:hypothetical protein
MTPSSCPRCNKPWDNHTPKKGMFVEYYESNCGLNFIPGENTFYIMDLHWDGITQIDWRSNTSFWKKHCVIFNLHDRIHSFATWLPFDITEEKLHKLLILI